MSNAAMIVVGSLSGIAAGLAYLWLLRSALQQLVAAQRLLHFWILTLLRLAVPVLVLVVMVRWDKVLFFSAAIGLAATQVIARLVAGRQANRGAQA